MDCGAEINLISQRFAVANELKQIPSELPKPQWMDGKDVYCYGAYPVRFELEDSWQRTRTCEAVFYAIDKEGADLVLGTPALKKEGIKIDFETTTWRYGFSAKAFELTTPKKMARVLRKGSKPIYALIAHPVAPDHEVDTVNIGGVDVDCSRKPSAEPVIPKEFEEYADVFSSQNAGVLATHKSDDHAIDLEGSDPPHGPLYNLSNTELAVLREYLDDALAKGWIRHSVSPAGAPVLFVPKKDGSLRLCVDYRGLNKITRKNRHPLPLITQILDQLNGNKFFSKIDLKDAYHRIRIRKGDEWKTAFRTRYGHFEYMVMPFGLANAPATFQAYVNKALAGIVDIFCVVYLDDILIFSKTHAEHVEHVKTVLQRLRKHDLYANLKKCEFFTTEVEYLGFIVSTEGIKMDPRRVETIKNWPKLTSYKDIQVFLGFANFYRRFIRRYSQITLPLTDQLKGMQAGVKKGDFLQSDATAKAFDELREAFQKAPILVHFDPQLHLRLETDASNFGVAGIISQLQADGQWKPVAYYSRKMIAAERNYETHDQELLAIVMCFKHWRHYLEGSKHPIEVLTDHNNLKGFMNVQVLSGRQARWAMKLAAYDFVIRHRAGKTNPADAPSRRPDYQGVNTEVQRLLPTLQAKLSMLGGLSIQNTPRIRALCEKTVCDMNSSLRSVGSAAEGTTSTLSEEPTGLVIAKTLINNGAAQSVPRAVVSALAVDENPFEGSSKPIQELIKALQAKDATVEKRRKEIAQTLKRKRSTGATPAWTVDSNDLLRYQGRLYVPDEESVRMELLKIHHDDELAGHYGAAKTTELLSRKYYWVGMTKYVKEYVETCDLCQRTKAPRHRPYGQMQSLPRPAGPWKEITMDFITGLPPCKLLSNTYDAILVVVDRYTKMALYIPVTKKINAVELAEVLYSKVFLIFGAPKGIVTDRGTVFTSDYWSAVSYHLKIKRRLSTAFHPQTDGQTERQNQTLEHYLRTYCSDEQTNWASLLPIAQYVYQVSEQSTLGCSPFYCMYGYNPSIQYEIEGDLAEERVPAARERVEQLHEFRLQLEERWKHVSETQAKYYNNKHTPMEFNVGDLVMLSTKNLKQKRPSKKLSHKFIGPFRILEPVGKQAYHLILPTAYRIHPVFHVSYLEPYKRRGNDADESFLPPPELINDYEEWAVEQILDRKSSKGKVYYKVKWVGWPKEYDTWEPTEYLDDAAEMRQEYDEEAKAKRRRKSKAKPDSI